MLSSPGPFGVFLVGCKLPQDNGEEEVFPTYFYCMQLSQNIFKYTTLGKSARTSYNRIAIFKSNLLFLTSTQQKSIFIFKKKVEISLRNRD